MQYLHRWVEKPFVSTKSKWKIRLLFGARQTGKSTLLKRVIGEDVFFVNLQDSTKRLELERRPHIFSEQILAKKEPSLKIAVDEIQKVPKLLEEIQWLYDSYPGHFEFFLTGSSARKLQRASANLLPGRSHVYKLFPIISAEREVSGKGFKHSIFPEITNKFSSIRQFPKVNLEELLLYGGLPGVIIEPLSTRIATLQGYSNLYLQEEIRQEGLVKEIGAFSQFLELAALESGKTVNLTALSNQSGVPVSTLRTYYQVLVDTFVGYWLFTFSGRERTRLLTTPRFYFFDVGVANASAGLPLDNRLLKIHGPRLFEQWVGLELIHRAGYLGAGYRVSFFRTVNGLEVDFIVETPTEIVPVEVKYTERPVPSDAKSIERFLELYPGRAHRGFVVCRCNEPQQLSGRVIAIPWWQL